MCSLEETGITPWARELQKYWSSETKDWILKSVQLLTIAINNAIGEKKKQFLEGIKMKAKLY